MKREDLEKASDICDELKLEEDKLKELRESDKITVYFDQNEIVLEAGDEDAPLNGATLRAVRAAVTQMIEASISEKKRALRKLGIAA